MTQIRICKYLIFIAALSANEVSAVPIFQWGGNWVQDAIGFPNRPAFGTHGPGTTGVFTEDHRFGANAVASGQVTDTNKMPGVLRSAAVAIQQSTLATGGVSAVQSWVQFSRTFSLNKEAPVTVGSNLSGFFDIEDVLGDALVRYNAGLADLSGNIIAQVYGNGSDFVQVIGLLGKRPINASGSVSRVLEPGPYKVWGSLGSIAAISADLLGGDKAEANFLSTHNVNLNVVEPATVLLMSLALTAFGFYSRDGAKDRMPI